MQTSFAKLQTISVYVIYIVCMAMESDDIVQCHCRLSCYSRLMPLQALWWKMLFPQFVEIDYELWMWPMAILVGRYVILPFTIAKNTMFRVSRILSATNVWWVSTERCSMITSACLPLTNVVFYFQFLIT